MCYRPLWTGWAGFVDEEWKKRGKTHSRSQQGMPCPQLTFGHPDAFLMLYVGRLSPEKSISVLLDALKLPGVFVCACVRARARVCVCVCLSLSMCVCVCVLCVSVLKEIPHDTKWCPHICVWGFVCGTSHDKGKIGHKMRCAHGMRFCPRGVWGVPFRANTPPERWTPETPV